MSLCFKTLSFQHFRNLEKRTISLNDGITVLQGHNASGKTNTVEALQLLTAGRSFRSPKLKDLIESGYKESSIQGSLEGDERLIDVGLFIKDHKKTFVVNNKKRQSYEMAHYLPSILFSPDDLYFIKGSAQVRRNDLDTFASQVSPGYAKILQAYTRSIEQRNKLLKEHNIVDSLLDAWDESVAYGAASVLKARFSLLERLNDHVSEIYQTFAPQECLMCSYKSSVTLDLKEDKTLLVESIFQALKEARLNDRRLGYTTVGPHRDDILFDVNNRDARAFCSQGQQRSLVLAWKLAQVELCEDITSKKPLLLLDDVMSELDEWRRSAIVDYISSGIQTVITTTNLAYFSEEMLQKAHVERYGNDI